METYTIPQKRKRARWPLLLAVASLAFTCRTVFATRNTHTVPVETAQRALEQGGLLEADRLLMLRLVRESALRTIAILHAHDDEHSAAAVAALKGALR